MIRRLIILLKHWRQAKTALSTLSFLYDSNSDALDVLGGLTDEEMRAVCAWASEKPGMTVVEVGTLFGLTAREIAKNAVVGKVIAVDNIMSKTMVLLGLWMLSLFLT